MNNPQNPKASAPCTLPPELPKEAVATDEAPPPMGNNNNTESATATMVREQDRLMPVANVSRIMRQVLPPYAKISDDAKEVIQECVSEFISFVTGEANERCHTERRKTVTSEDIVWAMSRLGFDDYVAPLGAFLQRMRDDSEGGGEERGGPAGRGGSRRGSSSLSLHCAQQMHHLHPSVCRRPHQGVSPAAGYAVRPVPRPMPASGYRMQGGDHRSVGGVAPCSCGGALVQAGGTQHVVGFHDDEASSSSENPPPEGRAAGSN
jgi:nuclear transcription Y subunit beta